MDTRIKVRRGLSMCMPVIVRYFLSRLDQRTLEPFAAISAVIFAIFALAADFEPPPMHPG
jgi:hypothetical protein